MVCMQKTISLLQEQISHREALCMGKNETEFPLSIFSYFFMLQGKKRNLAARQEEVFRARFISVIQPGGLCQAV